MDSKVIVPLEWMRFNSEFPIVSVDVESRRLLELVGAVVGAMMPPIAMLLSESHSSINFIVSDLTSISKITSY